MITEQKLTSLGLSGKLKGAGATQESEYRWYRGVLDSNTEWTLKHHGIDGHFSEEHKCSAFDCAELLDGIPSWLDDTHLLTIQKIETGEYHAGYVSSTGAYYRDRIFKSNRLAETLGESYLWLLANGHIKDQ